MLKVPHWCAVASALLTLCACGGDPKGPNAPEEPPPSAPATEEQEVLEQSDGRQDVTDAIGDALSGDNEPSEEDSERADEAS